MSELKPCPFCGGTKICTEKGINLNYCDNCSAESNIEHWNTRPIEDALNARIAELEADSVQIQYICEDELPEGISDEVFSAMYACSTVDFVRVYPYITIDGHKRFLVELPEVQE